MKFPALKLLILTLALLAKNASANYQAYCMKFTGERYVGINLFTSNDEYYKLVDRPKDSIFVVKAKTQNGLASLCTDGSLIDHGVDVNYTEEQSTPNQFVSAGYYVKNPVKYLTREEYQVRSSDK